MLSPSRRLPTAVLAAVLVAATAAGAELSTLNGKKYKGELVSVTADVLTFRTDVGAVGVSVKELFAVEFGNKVAAPAKGAKYDEIELIDGSVIRCSQFKIRTKAVEPALFPGPGDAAPPKVVLPLDNLFSILRGADDPKNRDEWKKLLAGRGKRDQFVVKRGEGFEPVSGTVIEGDDDGDAITFERESGERTTFKLIRATGGLVFNQPPRGVIPPTVCKVVDVFGNVLTAKAVELAGSGLKVTTVSGATAEYPSLSGVGKLDFSQGNVAYLSDLDPQVTAPEPVPGEPYFTYLRDKTNENAPLKLDGQTFGKGLWVFPDTTLTYAPNGDYREFKAVVGVDESVQVASSAVRLVIEADGKVVFSEVIRRKDKARPLNLDVKGVKQLKITVEREGLYLGNQVNLADARFQK
jgi:hypothetical protein